ncbi:G patch domain-containing protein 2-like isoform X2 [Cololabis saira]|nr:G patch domain-containing protein 2-like isoform X2 [Cololabis saira]XP_061599411.1 G patch domain-containing protein 2-like isoform X2 [Cololabis saira]
MMDELVQDLVSALDQASETSKLGELWEEMVLNPLQQRRQIRRRRGRKRFPESPFYPKMPRRCWIDASESSLDEAKELRENSSSAFTARLANCSDSDDVTPTDHWPAFVRGPFRPRTRTRQPSWQESDSFSENNPARPLKRRRKVKRMTSDVTVRLQQKLKVSGVDGKQRHRRSEGQRLSGSKRRAGGWMGEGSQTEERRLMSNKCWKRKLAKEHIDAADENMSEGETSSTCSSDPGLFTNDEGRQGDDEQSDWFFEGDCGVGTGMASLLPNWDSENLLSLKDKRTSPNFFQPARNSDRGYRSRVTRLPDSSACFLRRDRRRLPRKGNNMPVFVKRVRRFSHEAYQKDLRRASAGKQSQLTPMCPLPVCPIDMTSATPPPRCSSSSVLTNSLHPCWQTNFTPGLLCSANTRRRETEAVRITPSASNPFHVAHEREEAKGGSSNTATIVAVGPDAPKSFTSAQRERVSPPKGDHEHT